MTKNSKKEIINEGIQKVSKCKNRKEMIQKYSMNFLAQTIKGSNNSSALKINKGRIEKKNGEMGLKRLNW